MTNSTLSQLEILDNIFEPVVVVDSELKVYYFNNYFSVFTKHSPRKLKQAESIEEIFDFGEIELIDYIKKSEEAAAPVLTGESKIKLKSEEDQSYIVVLKLLPIELHGTKATMICFNDLSIEKSIFDKYKVQLSELKTNHSQIIQADKLATLGELTAGISHEISNPLTIASGSSEIVEMCLETSDLNEERILIESSLDDIKDAHSRINSIIINMKSYLHQNEEQKEYCQLNDMIENSVKLVTPSYKDFAVELKVAPYDTNQIVLANKIKIEQVLVNLLKNALYAIADKQQKDGVVEIRIEKNINENNISIYIDDNGPGVPEEIKESIFNTFFTTKDVGEGTGLGLSISSKILAAHQGAIFLEDKDSKGACFKIELPMIELAEFRSDEMLSNNITAGAHATRQKILAIDNEAQVLNVLREFFKESDFSFIGMEDAESALSAVENVDVDLIITDYKMPKMTGAEFVEAIRNRGINTPVLYLTSPSNSEFYNNDKDTLSLSGLILKPFSKEEVLKTVEMALSGCKEE